MLANRRKAAAISESFVFAIAVPTGLYSGAEGNSDRKGGHLFGMLRFLHGNRYNAAPHH
jgi:hypothetical protein